MEWQDLVFKQPSNQTAGNALALYNHWYLEWHQGMRDQLQKPSVLQRAHVSLTLVTKVRSPCPMQKLLSTATLSPTTTNLPPLVPGQSSYAHCFTQFPRNSMHLRGMEKNTQELGSGDGTPHMCIHKYFVVGFKKKQQNKQNTLESRGPPPPPLNSIPNCHWQRTKAWILAGNGHKCSRTPACSDGKH